MPRLQASLEAIPYSPRERVIAYRFRIENLGDDLVVVKTVAPKVTGSTSIKTLNAPSPRQNWKSRLLGRTDLAAVQHPAAQGPAASADPPLLLEPGQRYETHFVTSFSRRYLSPYPVTVAVDATVERRATAGTDLQALHACATETIAPNPVALTGMTVVGAVLGVVVRIALGLASEEADSVSWDSWSNYAAAAALAAILFNTYDAAGLGQRFRDAPSWRSALLIGALCGLFSEQIVAILSTMVGGGPS